MPEATLTRTAIATGRWHGVLTGPDAPPDLQVTHQGTVVAGLTVSDRADGDGWDVMVPIPTELIGDGVQTFVIADRTSGETLATFALMAGEALAGDIRAEIDLLRAELDMLKRAFRRHCIAAT